MEEKKTAKEYHFNSNNISTSVIIGSLLISISILLSGGVIRVNNGKIIVGSAVTGGVGTQVANVSPAPVPTPSSGPVKVALADAPVLGDKNAKVTMVEFSDYECPFCKRYFEDTYSQLKKDYIDTGKVKLVFRNLPLPFHQNAHKQAEAALCARDQGGDAAYFKYHDQIFTRTTSNGLGFALDKLAPLAGELGLSSSALQQCLDSGKYTAYVDKDIADADNYGATGTPTFFIGKSVPGGSIDGEMLVGAQPLSAFKDIIDKQLQ